MNNDYEKGYADGRGYDLYKMKKILCLKYRGVSLRKILKQNQYKDFKSPQSLLNYINKSSVSLKEYIKKTT